MRQRELQTTPSSSELSSFQARTPRAELFALQSPNLNGAPVAERSFSFLPCGPHQKTGGPQGGVLRREASASHSLTVYKLELPMTFGGSSLLELASLKVSLCKLSRFGRKLPEDSDRSGEPTPGSSENDLRSRTRPAVAAAEQHCP